jgi:hypothetical protein
MQPGVNFRVADKNVEQLVVAIGDMLIALAARPWSQL